MKNFNRQTLKKIMLLFGSISLCVSCDLFSHLNFDPFDHHAGDWYIKNSTDKTLYLTLYPHNDHYVSQNVLPGDSVLFYYSYFDPKDHRKPYFNRWIEPRQHMASSDEEIFLEVLSENDVVLKQWSYLEKNLPGKQLFKESSWHYYLRSSDATRIIADWIFEILPEDVSN